MDIEYYIEKSENIITLIPMKSKIKRFIMMVCVAPINTFHNGDVAFITKIYTNLSIIIFHSPSFFVVKLPGETRKSLHAFCEVRFKF